MTFARSRRWYRRLLRVLPKTFRWRHAEEMETVFAEALASGAARSRIAVVEAWFAAARDLAAFALLARFRRADAHSHFTMPRGASPHEEPTVFVLILRDIRYALRSFRKSPGFAAIAVVTIGLGIGATTLVFSVVYGVLLRPLPYAQSDRLVNVWNDLINERQYLPAVSPADFRDYQRMSEVFEAFAAASGHGQVGIAGVLTGDGPPQQVDVSPVSHNFFSLLGINPVLGRHFRAEEEVFQGPHVAIISHELWRTQFGADSSLLNGTIELDGAPFQVVGILPRGFRLLLPDEAFLIQHSDIWVPLQINYSNLPPRNWTFFTVLGRLKPDVTLEQAQTDMDRIATELRATYPEHVTSDMRIRLVPFQQDIVKEARSALLLLLGAVGFVLLIACANVAHLLLLRGTMRQREIALRSALGAGRATLVRHVLTESAVLAVTGGALGLLITAWGLDLLATIQPPNLPRVAELGINGPVMAFAVIAAVGTAVLFGFAPAFHAARANVTEVMKEGGRGGHSATTGRLRDLLMVGEIAFTVVLLVGTGLMIRSFAALQQVQPGFVPANVLTFRLTLPLTKYPQGPQRIAFFRQVEERLAAIPGVNDVGAVSQLPLTGTVPLWPYAYDDKTLSNFNLSADGRIATSDYFETTGTRLVAGRFFTPQDNFQNQSVVIVDEMLAERAWPNGDAIDKPFYLENNGSPPAVVVGVVEHARSYDLTEDVREQIFVPYDQRPTTAMSWAVRASLDPARLADAVRQEVWALDPDLPVDNVRPMTEYVSDAMAQTGFILLLMSAFGGLALVLACVGIYGVVSYAVSQRAREFGIRIALGASPGGIISAVTLRGARLVLISIGIGMVASLGLTRSLSSLLYDVSATDPATYIGVSCILFTVALVACYLPARRTAGADPVSALRAD
jgi:predicted permease